MNKSARYVELIDVLDNSVKASVRGIQFDAEYTAVIRQPAGMVAEIVSEQVGPISVVINGQYLLLDQNQLKNGYRSLYNSIVDTLGTIAIAKALALPDYKWKTEDYEGGT